jgi:hypothetical protein
MAVPMTADNDWGVTVEEVSALAPHVTIGEAPETPVDDTFHIPADRKITVNEVERFIEDVAGRVSLRLSDLPKITDDARVAAVGQAAHDAVVNGAGSYLVAAAYPAGGQVNSDGGYAAVLWARYESALEGAVTALDAWVVAIVPDTAGKIFSAFPAVMFPDGVRY